MTEVNLKIKMAALRLLITHLYINEKCTIELHALHFIS